jgi:hypothetical protein
LLKLTILTTHTSDKTCLFIAPYDGIYSINTLLQTNGTIDGGNLYVTFFGQPIQGSNNENIIFQYQPNTNVTTGNYNLYYRLNKNEEFFIQFSCVNIPSGQSLDVHFNSFVQYVGTKILPTSTTDIGRIA